MHCLWKPYGRRAGVCLQTPWKGIIEMVAWLPKLSMVNFAGSKETRKAQFFAQVHFSVTRLDVRDWYGGFARESACRCFEYLCMSFCGSWARGPQGKCLEQSPQICGEGSSSKVFMADCVGICQVPTRS